ncbi:DUF3152 domain-containing protein [Janibacter sp. GS2]|uniref:DUF3152 domain-containing protein n=1 Tax=Janibacter sp. GS2 TaxID=3442646 RepID=UPI003EBFA256
MISSRLAPTSATQARRRQLATGVVVLLAVALALLLLRPGPDTDEDSATAMTTSTTASPSSSPSPPSSSSSSSSSPSRTTPTLPDYVTTGQFSRMPTESVVRGRSGELISYRVEVEQGSGVTSREFAAVIDRTLSHRRGWTAGGQWRFQRVADGQADLVIRLATPDTVDERCAEAGVNTDGYASCRAGRLILLNLDRWYIGVPQVKDLTVYRQYLINHEVGHGLGRGHEACPGKGRPAPVMLQQTLDLDGCTANPWPRGPDGRPVRGEPIP